MIKGVYPVLDPPEHLTGIGPAQRWTLKIAQENYHWVMSVRSARIADLLKYFELSFPAEGEEFDFLLHLGDLLAAELFNGPNSELLQGKRELRAPGLSMVYDTALLIAELLIRASGGVARWVLYRARPSSPEFNTPALIGKNKDWELGVIRVSLVHANLVLMETRSSDAWANIYRAMLDRLMRA